MLSGLGLESLLWTRLDWTGLTIIKLFDGHVARLITGRMRNVSCGATTHTPNNSTKQLLNLINNVTSLRECSNNKNNY